LSVPYRLQVSWQANAGQCAARNRGAAAAAGRVCLFLDDDVIAEPGLLAAHLAAQRGSGVVGLGRLVMDPPPEAGALGRAVAHMWNTHYDRLGQGRRPAAWRDCYSGNLSAPQAAFMQVGGFAEDLPAGFDIELGYRLAQHGLTCVYLPAAGPGGRRGTAGPGQC
jgi:GT2 family glycosyltransferase